MNTLAKNIKLILTLGLVLCLFLNYGCGQTAQIKVVKKSTKAKTQQVFEFSGKVTN